MTKGPSEAAVRDALRAMNVDSYVYKPPDDARNWKPCDFMVWWHEDGEPPGSAWIEVKETKAVKLFNLPRELRVSQTNGILDAVQLGIPYLLVVHWTRQRDYTISDAAQLPLDDTVTRADLMTRYGVNAQPRDLAMMLRAALLEGLT